jgi:hypothetical protein
MKYRYFLGREDTYNGQWHIQDPRKPELYFVTDCKRRRILRCNLSSKWQGRLYPGTPVVLSSDLRVIINLSVAIKSGAEAPGGII